MNTQDKLELFIERLLNENESPELLKMLEDDPELMQVFKKYVDANKLLNNKLDSPLLKNNDDDSNLNSLSLEQRMIIDDEVDEHLMKKKQDLTQDEKEFREIIRKIIRKKSGRSSLPEIPLFYKIAAVLILGLIFGLVLIRPVNFHQKSINATMAYMKYYDPVNDEYFESFDSYNMSFQRAIIAFRKTDYNTAISSLNEISEDYDTEYNYHILKGLIMLEKGESVKARELLKTAMERSKTTSRFVAQWYLGLTLLKENKTSDALPLFRELSDTRNPYRRDAKRILRKVKWD